MRRRPFSWGPWPSRGIKCQPWAWTRSRWVNWRFMQLQFHFSPVFFHPWSFTEGFIWLTHAVQRATWIQEGFLTLCCEHWFWSAVHEHNVSYNSYAVGVIGVYLLNNSILCVGNVMTQVRVFPQLCLWTKMSPSQTQHSIIINTATSAQQS